MAETQTKLPQMRLTVIEKAAANEVQSNALETEDTFQTFYQTTANTGAVVLEPPYNLDRLSRLTQENNALGPCIEAMVQNVDGTGYAIESSDGESEDRRDDKNVLELEKFFNEPYPGQSFISQRRRLRRDVESIGFGVLEVMRNPKDEIVFLRYVDSKTTRFVKLDEPVDVEVRARRRGKEIPFRMKVRERRYAQMFGVNQLVYFKEFGASRDLDKDTGRWAAPGQRLPFEKRATEFLVFGALPDAKTPYPIPRWIAQMPSVLGSRAAEELNLAFFDSGGLPPILIILQGGNLAPEAEKAMKAILNGSTRAKLRGAVLETHASGGSLDKAGNVRVSIERFGAERQSDSMFEKYDEKTEQRVRRAFRLPPLFVGQAGDYSFATAFASYTVAEAQVFRPEREEFDEVISVKLIPALGYPGYQMRSLPLQVHDAALKMQGIQLVQATNRVEPGDIVEAINEAANLSLKVTDAPVNPAPQAANPDTTISTSPSGTLADNGVPPGASPAEKSDTPAGVRALAETAMLAMRSRNADRMLDVAKQVLGLPDEAREQYRQQLAVMQFIDTNLDADGLAMLASGTVAALAHQNRTHAGPVN